MIDLFRHMFGSTTGIYVNQFVKFLKDKTSILRTSTLIHHGYFCFKCGAIV